MTPSIPLPASGPLTFVIWAPAFNNESGGAIALHHLCHRLNKAGHRALLWPSYRVRITIPPRPGALLWNLRGWLRGWDRKFATGPFPNRLARAADLADAVVIYPEVVSGNPLRAGRVVRWLLHRPGHWTNGASEYGADDLFFFFQDAFNDPTINPDPDSRLVLAWHNDVYRDFGGSARRGTCYLLRKGKDRSLVHDVEGSILIDDLSHAHKAELFNRCERFYSYDPYTMYSQYAAMCGCVPVVVPQPGVSEETWLPSEEDRYGLAYGEDRIAWAIATRPALFERMSREIQAEEDMIARMVAKCRTRFGLAGGAA
jgi:hypothetical protein